jgi:hypothetical protein
MTPTGAIYELYDVGLYYDPLATGAPPRWQMPDPVTELALCQRYWQLLYATYDSGYVTAGEGHYGRTPYVVPPRTLPAFAFVTGVGTNFPTGPGGVGGFDGFSWYENRIASGTGPAYFDGQWKISARM